MSGIFSEKVDKVGFGDIPHARFSAPGVRRHGDGQNASAQAASLIFNEPHHLFVYRTQVTTVQPPCDHPAITVQPPCLPRLCVPHEGASRLARTTLGAASTEGSIPASIRIPPRRGPDAMTDIKRSPSVNPKVHPEKS